MFDPEKKQGRGWKPDFRAGMSAEQRVWWDEKDRRRRRLLGWAAALFAATVSLGLAFGTSGVDHEVICAAARLELRNVSKQEPEPLTGEVAEHWNNIFRLNDVIDEHCWR